jgi:hypothetical protein
MVDFTNLVAAKGKSEVSEGSGGHHTPGDETGAREVWRKTVEQFTLNGVEPKTEFERKAINAIAWLTSELARVTSERDEATEGESARAVERDAAIASRNAWAEKCAALRGILETTATALELEEFTAFAARLRESLAATEEKL